MRKQEVMKRLKAARGFVFDMDGTLVLGNKDNKGLEPLPGALELVRLLRDRGVPCISFTNGTTRPPAAYGVILRKLGFPLQDDEIMTPASAAADYFSRRGYKRVMVLGGEGVWGPIADAGIEVVQPAEGAMAEAIFVGWFREFTMDHIEIACRAVWQGAELFTSSLAPFFATANGRALGTSVAIVGAITKITRCKIKVLGKPSPEALRSASRRMGIPTRELAVVGDDPALEVPMAHSGKSLAIGVTTGVSTDKDFAALPPVKRAHIVLPGVDELLKLYSSAHRK
jgi:4-nitrophenyl phosphatase